MAAAVWTGRGRKAVTVVGTVTRSRSSHAALRSQYDALVIGGGEICARLEEKVQKTQQLRHMLRHIFLFLQY